MSHYSLIFLRIANRKKRIMVGFALFLGHFEQIANSKSELCNTGLTSPYAKNCRSKRLTAGISSNFMFAIATACQCRYKIDESYEDFSC